MRILIGFLFLFIISFGNYSCQKEFVIGAVDSSLITPPNIPTSGPGSFTASIDGVKFVANKVAAAAKTSGVIAITGQNADGENIVLRVADSSVHNYSLTINSATNVGAYNKDTAYSYTTNGGNSSAQSGGSMSITSIDTVKKTMSGTFNMKVYRQFDNKQKIISEGVFTDIPYATTAIPPANAADTFSVKVDGVNFPDYSINGYSFFGKISLSASNQDVSKTVGISIPSDILEGTYTFSMFDLNYIGQYNIGTTIFMSASSGTLTILEHNKTTKRIRGNFNFSAKDLLGGGSAALTEGYFSVVYQ